ncbi:hypothetical protein VNO77_18715 [Canavalia gladiata]|uniref:Uncharacterized protein n=1 Tax=Canavalia gladiata TaxID=3824 RepID=A0AAN9LL99_CANGL
MDESTIGLGWFAGKVDGDKVTEGKIVRRISEKNEMRVKVTKRITSPHEGEMEERYDGRKYWHSFGGFWLLLPDSHTRSHMGTCCFVPSLPEAASV